MLNVGLKLQFMGKKGRENRQNEPSQEYKQYIKNLQRKIQKYYLVGITGRTSFILENIKATKFKITIGNDLKCSCSPNCFQHCMHTLYTLTEIFYLEADNPLCFKNHYTDPQLRYIIANRRIHTNRIQQFLKCTKVYSRKNQIILEAEQGEEQDDEDDICAICHMQIVKQDATTSCNTVCLNKFHLDCFSQWVSHQQQQKNIVKCPLCRDQKNPDYLLQIKLKTYQLKENANSKKIGLSYGNYCDGCQLKEIQSHQTVYKCVQCEDVTICQSCFQFGRHIRHSFICKKSHQKKWRQCEDRKNKKKLDVDQSLIRMKLPNNRRLANFLAAAIPCYFSRNTRWNIIECKKLDIKVQQLQCFMCNDKQKAFLRKLKCGHFLHHKCLRKRIEKGYLHCKLDGRKYLLGYDSLLKHLQLNRKVKQVVDEQQELQQQQKDIQDVNNSNINKFTSTFQGQKSTSCDLRNKIIKKDTSIQNKTSCRNRSVTSKRRHSHKKNINPQ